MNDIPNLGSQATVLFPICPTDEILQWNAVLGPDDTAILGSVVTVMRLTWQTLNLEGQGAVPPNSFFH